MTREELKENIMYLTYEEYKETHLKMTKKERAFYRVYGLRLMEEEHQQKLLEIGVNSYQVLADSLNVPLTELLVKKLGEKTQDWSRVKEENKELKKRLSDLGREYDEIKDRKGYLREDGTFIKQTQMELGE